MSRIFIIAAAVELAAEPQASADTATASNDKMAAVAGDQVNVTRSGESQFSTPAAQPATDPVLARNIRQQVVRQFSSQLANVAGQEKITIKLNPESLGQIELNFEARDDNLKVVITANTHEAEGAMRESLKELTDRIVERSSRFSHVDVRVEVREGNDTRHDSKQDQKQDGKQDQKRDQGRQENNQGGQGHQGQQAQKAWESAMSWHLAEQAGSEEG
jgi:flagellar hook-length control protein FliK